MNKGTWLILAFLGWATACQQAQSDQSAPEKLLEELHQLEKQLLKAGDASKAKTAAIAFVEKSKSFASAYPEHSSSPELLFKGADIARGAKEYGKAVQLWGLLWRGYKDHPKAPMALFLQGFTFDSDLQNVDMAKRYYRNFLKTYPSDSLAVQVQQLLQVVETSPEDLVKQFEQNR